MSVNIICLKDELNMILVIMKIISVFIIERGRGFRNKERRWEERKRR